MTTAHDAVPPVVCTLTTKERAQRGLAWTDLGRLALTSRRIDDGVTSTYSLELADEIEDLASLERTCCGSWLTIATVRSADAITLQLTTSNPDGLAMIESIAGLSAS